MRALPLLGRVHPGVPDKRVHGDVIGQSKADTEAEDEGYRQGDLTPSGNAGGKAHVGIDPTNAVTRPLVSRVLIAPRAIPVAPRRMGR